MSKAKPRGLKDLETVPAGNERELSKVTAPFDTIPCNDVKYLKQYINTLSDKPGIIAAANGTFVRLRDHDQPVGVCVAFPGILDLGERNTFSLDAQCAAGNAVHHLLERVSEYVPRRHSSGS